MSEVWNNVGVYGPASEIERFKRLCIAPSVTEYVDHQFGWDGCFCTISVPRTGPANSLPLGGYQHVDNFQQFETETDRHYAFSFDSVGWFPEDVFCRLADVFPSLSFECECIESMDGFMGFGWFNPPPGGEEFDQSFDVPADHWDGGSGHKRSRAAEAEHRERVARLMKSLEDGA